jgi:hypothetical protein
MTIERVASVLVKDLDRISFGSNACIVMVSAKILVFVSDNKLAMGDEKTRFSSFV